MEKNMGEFISELGTMFSESSYVTKCLVVFFCAMIPIGELRLSIPVGALLHLDYVSISIFSIIGNLLPVPFLVIFGGKILRYFAKFPKLGKPFRGILNFGEKKVGKMKKTLFYGLWLFVGLPLPGTGAWSGCLISITLSKKLKEVWFPITLGVLTAFVIVLIITLLVDKGITWLEVFI
ncbi:MAG: small multi-drug export protein [Clostridia bacterium]